MEEHPPLEELPPARRAPPSPPEPLTGSAHERPAGPQAFILALLGLGLFVGAAFWFRGGFAESPAPAVTPDWRRVGSLGPTPAIGEALSLKVDGLQFSYAVCIEHGPEGKWIGLAATLRGNTPLRRVWVDWSKVSVWWRNGPSGAADNLDLAEDLFSPEFVELQRGLKRLPPGFDRDVFCAHDPAFSLKDTSWPKVGRLILMANTAPLYARVEVLSVDRKSGVVVVYSGREECSIEWSAVDRWWYADGALGEFRSLGELRGE